MMMVRFDRTAVYETPPRRGRAGDYPVRNIGVAGAFRDGALQTPTCSIKTALDFDRRLRLRDPLGTADPAAETGVACERYGSRATAYSKFTQDNGDMIADGFLAYT